MKKIILLSMLTISIVVSNAKTPFIDGVIMPDEYDAKIATGDGKSCPFNIANGKEMYFAQDAYFYYLAVSFKATTSMNWAFIISLNDRDGGAYDPRPRMVTYEHPRKPSLMISGSFNSPLYDPYNVYVHNGSYWEPSTYFLGSQIASNVMVSDQDDCLEISIPKSYLGLVTRFDAQFYLSGAILTRNTVYDAIPDDNIPTSETSKTILHNYAHSFTPLPITLTNFNVISTNDAVNLKWEYTNAFNFSHFEIIRNNVVIGSTKNTSFKDIHPLNENVYKLKMIDNDGTFTYSKSVLVNINDNKRGISILENPVHNTIKLKINGLSNLYQITLLSIEGKQIFTTSLNYQSNTNFASIKLPFYIQNGIYHLVVKSNNELYNTSLLIN